MARLYDRLLAANGDTRLAGATVLVADNVADYYWGTAPEKERFTYRDFHNVAPPLDNLFVECRMPDRSLYNRWPDDWPRRWGALFHAIDRDAAASDPWAPDLRYVPDQHWMRDRRWKWIQVAGMVCWHPLFGFDPRAPQFAVPVDEAGAIALDDTEGVTVIGDTPTELDRGHNREVLRFLFPLLLAISFTHCKNVESREVEQPAPLSKKWQKKHGRPLVRYHVLDIDPMRKVLKTEGRSDEVGLKKALHICRGHFATYTEDAPLFGRITGTFWRPQHVRGSAKEGIVVKDYNVKAKRP